MKILYANVIEVNAGWGAEVFVNDALIKSGHETHCIDFWRHRRHLAKQVLQAPPFDSFLLQRGNDFPISILEALRCPRFFWASELVSRCRDQDRLFKWGKFDHVWVRGTTCRDEILRRGWLRPNQCSILLSGYHPELHRPDRSSVKDIDVLFVGSMTPRRMEFFEELKKSIDVQVASAFGEGMMNLFHRAKIVLNIHAGDFKDVETRVFEALGCGSFVLSEKLADENPFGPQDYVEFEGIEDLKSQISYFLTHDDKREAIAMHGHNSARNGHTWEHRALQIANQMEITKAEWEKRKHEIKMVNRPLLSAVAVGEYAVLPARGLRWAGRHLRARLQK